MDGRQSGVVAGHSIWHEWRRQRRRPVHGCAGDCSTIGNLDGSGPDVHGEAGWSGSTLHLYALGHDAVCAGEWRPETGRRDRFVVNVRVDRRHFHVLDHHHGRCGRYWQWSYHLFRQCKYGALAAHRNSHRGRAVRDCDSGCVRSGADQTGRSCIGSYRIVSFADFHAPGEDNPNERSDGIQKRQLRQAGEQRPSGRRGRSSS
jgi:hypothetical protein